MPSTSPQTWDLWIPDAAARGVSFARGRLDAHDTLFVHAAPGRLDVDILDDAGVTLAQGKNLAHQRHTDGAPASRR